MTRVDQTNGHFQRPTDRLVAWVPSHARHDHHWLRVLQHGDDARNYALGTRQAHAVEVARPMLRVSMLHEFDDRAQLRVHLLLFRLTTVPLASLVLDLLQHLHNVYTLKRLFSDFFKSFLMRSLTIVGNNQKERKECRQHRCRSQIEPNQREQIVQKRRAQDALTANPYSFTRTQIPT